VLDRLYLPRFQSVKERDCYRRLLKGASDLWHGVSDSHSRSISVGLVDILATRTTGGIIDWVI
jgi:hypothetical protein